MKKNQDVRRRAAIKRRENDVCCCEERIKHLKELLKRLKSDVFDKDKPVETEEEVLKEIKVMEHKVAVAMTDIKNTRAKLPLGEGE